MGTSITPELSKSNKYYISRNRYYELKHFCLQYNDWKKDIAELEDKVVSTSLIFHKKQTNFSDPVYKNASEIFSLERKSKIVDLAISKLDTWIQPFIFAAVTEGRSFTYLKAVLEIPCERDTYYDRYRRFFYILDGCRDV